MTEAWEVEPVDPSLRVSHEDRGRVIALLRDHTSAGRLTIDEFGDRVGEVYEARTFGDLQRALRELPVGPVRRRAFVGQRFGPAVAGFVPTTGICGVVWAI